MNRQRVVESNQQAAAVGATNHEADTQLRVLLLDLSGDTRAATEWAAAQFGHAELTTLNKADLKWASRREALAQARARRPEVFSIFTSDLSTQSRLAALMLFGVLAGGRRVVIGDRNGRTVSRARLGVVLLETSRLAFELTIGFLLLIPFSWMLTEVLGLALHFRPIVHTTQSRKRNRSSINALYIRATL